MSILSRIVAPLVVAISLGMGLAGCASEAITISDDTVIIDVRTAEEFSAGHVEGAVNIDVQAPDFDARVAELPEDGDYVVYCRSGNRSALAIDRMAELGVMNAQNAGGLDAAAEATGLPIIE